MLFFSWISMQGPCMDSLGGPPARERQITPCILAWISYKSHAYVHGYIQKLCMHESPQRHPAEEVQTVHATPRMDWSHLHGSPCRAPCRSSACTCLPGGPPPGTRASGPHVAPHMHPSPISVPPWRTTARDTEPWDPMRYPACIPPSLLALLFFFSFSLDGASGENCQQAARDSK